MLFLTVAVSSGITESDHDAFVHLNSGIGTLNGQVLCAHFGAGQLQASMESGLSGSSFSQLMAGKRQAKAIQYENTSSFHPEVVNES